MTGQYVGRRVGLAEVVHQHSEPGFIVVAERGACLQRHQDMQPGIDLRVIPGGLRYPEEGVDFGEQAMQYAAVSQRGNKYRWIGFVEGAR